jgi:hypothetical protein
MNNSELAWLVKSFYFIFKNKKIVTKEEISKKTDERRDFIEKTAKYSNIGLRFIIK